MSKQHLTLWTQLKHKRFNYMLCLDLLGVPSIFGFIVTCHMQLFHLHVASISLEYVTHYYRSDAMHGLQDCLLISRIHWTRFYDEFINCTLSVVDWLATHTNALRPKTYALRPMAAFCIWPKIVSLICAQIPLYSTILPAGGSRRRFAIEWNFILWMNRRRRKWRRFAIRHAFNRN